MVKRTSFSSDAVKLAMCFPEGPSPAALALFTLLGNIVHSTFSL